MSDCRECDDTGEWYGNLGVRCGCAAGDKRTDLPSQPAAPPRPAVEEDDVEAAISQAVSETPTHNAIPECLARNNELCAGFKHLSEKLKAAEERITSLSAQLAEARKALEAVKDELRPFLMALPSQANIDWAIRLIDSALAADKERGDQ